MRNRILTWTLVIVLSMTLGGAAVLGLDELRSDGGKTAVISQAVPSTTTNVAGDNVQDLADLYASVRSSVVTIEGSSSRTQAQGLGSGVVIDKQGHILTNNHVVQGFDVLDVTFADGNAYPARVVGRDPGNDLAIIEVDAPRDTLEPAVLGDSDSLRVGELLIAVGNPLNLSGSVTQGIVSGVGRTLSSGTGRPLRQLIQSDAAINPGNSGGGLFNKNGQLIGITTAIDNEDGQRAFAGIGYSVPINLAKRFLPDMLAGRVVEHPRLGIELSDLKPSEASSLGLPVDRGILIRAVQANSAAARAGLRGTTSGRSGVGDVIIAIDDKPVKSFEDLAGYLDTKKVGDKVQLKLMREGREVNVDVTLEAWQG